MKSKLSISKKIQMILLFIAVGFGFYFSFKRKAQMFWTPEYLFGRMVRDQKAVHNGTDHKVSTARERYYSLQKIFRKIFPSTQLKLGLTQQELRQVYSSISGKSDLWKVDLFKAFRHNWNGVENIQGTYKKFLRQNYSEHYAEDNLFIHFFELINSKDKSFYALYSYRKMQGHIIYGEVIDASENLSWPSIAWPIDESSMLVFTQISEGRGQSTFKLSVERVKGNDILIKGLEVLYQNEKGKILKVDTLTGKFSKIKIKEI